MTPEKRTEGMRKQILGRAGRRAPQERRGSVCKGPEARRLGVSEEERAAGVAGMEGAEEMAVRHKLGAFPGIVQALWDVMRRREPLSPRCCGKPWTYLTRGLVSILQS